MNEFSSIVTEGWRHKFFANGTEIEGIQSISFNQPLQLETYNYLGLQPLTKYNGNKVASINVKKQLFDNDILLQYTGNNGINGLILENNTLGLNNLGFTSGFLTSYSLTINKNQPIEVDANINIFGDYGQMDGNEHDLFNYQLEGISGAPPGYIFLGPIRPLTAVLLQYQSGYNFNNILNTGDTFFASEGSLIWSGQVVSKTTINFTSSTTRASSSQSTKLYKKKKNYQVSANSIEISLDEFNTNRVNSFNLSVSRERIPVYCLGQSSPYEINSSNPININCSFEIEMNGYQFQKTKLYPTGFYRAQNLSLSVKDYISGSIQDLNFNNLYLTAHDYLIDADGTAKVQLSYIGQA